MVDVGPMVDAHDMNESRRVIDPIGDAVRPATR
jgi:hypothetical protein